MNHDYFQRAVDLRPTAVAAAPTLASIAQSYELPFKLMGHLDNVLVVGCGMGNDVAAALRVGSKQVTAVEINPAIIRLGKELHPEHPLTDSRTTTVLNDAGVLPQARAGQKRQAVRPGGVRAARQPDRAALSSMSSVRLEFFVYTVESMREALSLLDKENGLAAVTFSVGWRRLGRPADAPHHRRGGRRRSAGDQLDEYDGGVTFITRAGPGQAGSRAAGHAWGSRRDREVREARAAVYRRLAVSVRQPRSLALGLPGRARAADGRRLAPGVARDAAGGADRGGRRPPTSTCS